MPECPECKYELGGLPDGQCPECGVPFTHDALRRRSELAREAMLRRADALETRVKQSLAFWTPAVVAWFGGIDRRALGFSLIGCILVVVTWRKKETLGPVLSEYREEALFGLVVALSTTAMTRSLAGAMSQTLLALACLAIMRSAVARRLWVAGLVCVPMVALGVMVAVQARERARAGFAATDFNWGMSEIVQAKDANVVVLTTAGFVVGAMVFFVLARGKAVAKG